MTLTNHALAGAVLAVTLRSPWALPLALLTHFFLDMAPHFGGVEWFEKWSKGLLAMAISDTLAAILVTVMALALFPHLQPLIFGCVALATLPDWPWVLHFAAGWQHRYFTWHQAIQRLERPWGGYVEGALGVVLVFSLWFMHN